MRRILALAAVILLLGSAAYAAAPTKQLPDDLTLADWQAAAVGSVTAPFTFSDYEYLDQIEVQ